MNDPEKIRNTIIIAMYNLGLTQKDLAAKLGVPASTLNSWLRRGRDIPAQYIVDIADYIQRSPMYLLTGNPDYLDPVAPPLLVQEENISSGQKDREVSRLSDDGLKVGRLWDQLDKPGQAIILGEIYKRLELSSEITNDGAHDLRKA